jgi:hypothetical protein
MLQQLTLLRDFPLTGDQTGKLAFPTMPIRNRMERGGSNIPFERPLRPSKLPLILLLDSIHPKELLLQVVSEGPDGSVAWKTKNFYRKDE